MNYGGGWMRKALLAALIAVLFYPAAYSYGFPTNNQDCSKGHTLTKDEASTLLKDIIPNIKVIDVRPAPVESLWEVDFESNGQKSLVYVDYSKKHLFAGAIADIKERKNLTQERLAELTKVDASQIPLKDALVMGDRDAQYKVIVFDDPD